MGTRVRSSVFLVTLIASMLLPVASAHAATTEVCAVNADSQEPGPGFDRADVISLVDVSDFDPATNETTLGRTGTDWIESVVFGPDGTLYAAEDDQLGRIDLTTGLFTATSRPYGTGRGMLGRILIDDIDGLAFSTSGTLWASSRRTDEEPDLLVKLDPSTGAHIPDAFGAGKDYLVVDAPSADRDLWDIDDIAFLGDTLYAVANLDGRGDRLVTIDTTTGETTSIGRLGQRDMEGLTDATSGDHLWGVTGDANVSAIWRIDPATGDTSQPRRLDNANDYEGIDCRTMEVRVESARVAVRAGACAFQNGTSITPATIGIEPAGAATLELRDGNGDLVDSFTRDGRVRVEPGTYTWRAMPAPGFEIIGDATGSFRALPCGPDVSIASVEIGPCEFIGDRSVSDLVVRISPVGSATVVVTDAAGHIVLETSSSETIQVGPGTYTYAITPDTGVTIPGPTEGTVTAARCAIADSVQVSVTPTSCVFREDLGKRRVPIDIVVNPAGAAEVTIERVSGTDKVVGIFDASGSVDVVGGNRFRWRVDPAPGYTLIGPSSGSFETEVCVEPAISATVSCTYDADLDEARARVVLSQDDEATVAIDGPGAFEDSFRSSGRTGPLAAGTYSWTATADPGNSIIPPRSGTFVVDPANALCGLPATGMTADVTGIAGVGRTAVLIGVLLAIISRLRFRMPSPFTAIGIPVFMPGWSGFRPTGSKAAGYGRTPEPIRRPTRRAH